MVINPFLPEILMFLVGPIKKKESVSQACAAKDSIHVKA